MSPATVLDMLANFALFDTSGGGADMKYLPRYPQMEAAHLIHERVLAGGSTGPGLAPPGVGQDAADGVRRLPAAGRHPDRVAHDHPALGPDPARPADLRGVHLRAGGRLLPPADTSQELRALLAGDVRGVIATTVHKFADAGKNLSARDNIIVMVDEAHRTQSDRGSPWPGSCAARCRTRSSSA